MPKVSIIIPTYNVENYLKECLDSVINQTLKDIEIICIDDGSTDSSGTILDEYAKLDNRIKVIHKENGGYGKAMNIGIDNATGEYLGIVEPDDYIKSNMYEDLYNIAKENNVDFVKADFYRFKGSNDNIELFYNKLSTDDKYYNKVINVNKEITPYYFIMNTWCGIYNINFLNKYNIRHNESPGASFQDNGFWFQTFVYSERGYFVNKPYYMNRRDNPNSSVYNKEKIFSVPDEFCWIENKIKNTPDVTEKGIGIFYHIKYLGYMAGYSRVHQKFKYTYLKRFSKDFKKTIKEIPFDETLYSSAELKKLYMIIENPNKYYRKSNNLPSLSEKLLSHKYNNTHNIFQILGIKLKFRRN